MDFSEAIKNEQKWTLTENGAVALNTTGTALLDLFGTIGALRSRKPIEIETMLEDAYNEDPLNTVKCIMYARDVREGLGERRVFRIALKWFAKRNPQAVIKNIALIAEYGRYDDYYELIDTPVENAMWNYLHQVFRQDAANMGVNKFNGQSKPVSLLAKWLKTADASSKKTRQLGILTAKKFGMTVYTYKRMVRALRKYLEVVEPKMCANEWSKIDYSAVPSRASMLYKNAFMRHDEDRYTEFIDKVNKGEAKINASTLYPYDILERYSIDSGWATRYSEVEDPAVEALWKNLPNYVEPGTNAVVMADTSGSMNGRPMNSAVGLAIYFAERNTGAYHNLWMNFSDTPKWQKLRGKTLCQKLNNMDMDNWDNNTDLHAAFKLVLNTAIKNNVSQDEMPKSIIVISDMEIDSCGDRNWTFYDQMRSEFAERGYQIPQIIFWNVNSRHDVFHADKTRKGVILCGGQSTTTFKTLINSVDMNPVEYMMSVLNSKRYEKVVCPNIETSF